MFIGDLIVASRTRRQMPARAAADITPTPERSTHGVVERAERIISDVVGRPGRPYRLVDTLAMMERRGSITAGMRQAGEDFRDRFAVAQLDPLKAFDISRPRIANRTGFRGGNEPGSRIESARKVVWGCDSCGRRPSFRRRILRMARRRMATVTEGMGSGAGVEWSPDKPGSSFRNSDRLSRDAGSAFRPIATLLNRYVTD